MSQLPHKYSDPWLNKDESSQTDDTTSPQFEDWTSSDSGIKSTSTFDTASQTLASLDEQSTLFGSDMTLASESSVQTTARQQCWASEHKKMEDEISNPWIREKNVVMAVDGSDISDQALDFYLDNIHKLEYKIVLVHCADIPRIPLCDEIPREEWNTQLQHKDKSIRLLEDDYAAKLRNEGVTFSTRFFYHPKPGCGILQVAEEVNAAFVVTGSRGLGRLRKTILGSVSDYLTQHSKVPVIICPAEKAHYKYHYDSSSQIIKSRVELDLIAETEDIPRLRLSHEDLSGTPEKNPSPGLNRRSFVLIDI